jgi:hypothetical protein
MRRLLIVLVVGFSVGACSTSKQAAQPPTAAHEGFTVQLPAGFSAGERGHQAVDTPTAWQYRKGEWLDVRTTGGDAIRVFRMEGENLSLATEPPHTGPGATSKFPLKPRSAVLEKSASGLAIAWVESDRVEYTVSSSTAGLEMLQHVAEGVQEN